MPAIALAPRRPAAAAHRLTAEAARRLRPGARGRIHSVFARAVNIRLDGEGVAGWLSLHGPGPIPSPFGLACAGVRVSDATPGAPVRVLPGALSLRGLPPIRLEGAVVADTTLPAAAPEPVLGPCLDVAAAAQGGLLPVAAAILAGARPPAGPLGRLAGPALGRLLAATARADAPACLAAAGALLGLGPGLTPAGDDCLLGWIAGLRTAGLRGRTLAEAVGPALLAVARRRTGALSLALLAAAVAGAVGEPLRRFVGAPGPARLRGLLALGATSGADCLGGYLLARRAVPGRGDGAPPAEEPGGRP